MSSAYETWLSQVKKSNEKIPPRRERFITISDQEVPALVTPNDVAGIDFDRDISYPGSFPYTRGVQSTMYRSKFWTMRQFAGFSSPEETNKRFKMLLKEGQTGLSTAFDMPTLMGLDSDNPKSKGEVGKCGVSVSSLADMEILYDGIDLGSVTTSMTVNAPAIVLMCMYFAVAKKNGVKPENVRGTLQNDILKEYIAQKEWIYPIDPAVKLVIDTIEYGTKNYPGWNTVSISGYHIREAGATAAEELAFTISDGLAYVEECIKRGLDVDHFAPRLSFFFDVHNDFFEEIGKFRAARRIWARLMKERFNAKDARSMMLRTHAQTAGVSLTAQQPENNIVRVALQALAGVLGGVNSLHTNSMDETLALPTDKSVMLALRTQQILAEETGVANTVDPLGGSYFVEWMTNRVERDALHLMEKIDQQGGMIQAVKNGFPQSEIANSAYRYQKQLENGDQSMVGVNCFKLHEPKRTLETLYIDRAVEARQIQRLAEVKRTRDSVRVADCLKNIRTAAERGDNMCESIFLAVEAYATVGEICDEMKTVFGEYRESGVF